jgi:hypothetical protein
MDQENGATTTIPAKAERARVPQMMVAPSRGERFSRAFTPDRN